MECEKWVTAIASVLFDIDEGQRCELVVPAGALTAEEKQAVAFHAFPDSMSMELHARSAVRDTSFWFRVPRSAPAPDQPTSSHRFLYG
ncbi:uncharacterized protein HaLaN_15095, partial [Haematococcus lacustris]